MEINSQLEDFEKHLGRLIKRCFEKELYDDADEFYIAADYDTHCRLNSLLEPIGLEVYGMSVTLHEFKITLEFTGDYENLLHELTGPTPRYCNLSLSNDGNYEITLNKVGLSEMFRVTVTDHRFNIQALGEKEFYDVIKVFNEVLLVYALKS